MKQFVLTRPAEDDLHQIKNDLAERADPTMARRVMKEIRFAMDLLGDRPDLGHVREDLTNRLPHRVRSNFATHASDTRAPWGCRAPALVVALV